MSAEIFEYARKQATKALMAQGLVISMPALANDIESTAVLALNQSEHSIPRGDLVYTSLVVSLQKKIREANHTVSNLALQKKDQPDWSKGLTAVDSAVKAYDNESLTTVILVDATRRELSNNLTEIQLSYTFYDAEERSVYRTFEADAVVATSCEKHCATYQLVQEFKKLDKTLISSIVASLGEVQLPAIAQLQK